MADNKTHFSVTLALEKLTRENLVFDVSLGHRDLHTPENRESKTQ